MGLQGGTRSSNGLEQRVEVVRVLGIVRFLCWLRATLELQGLGRWCGMGDEEQGGLVEFWVGLFFRCPIPRSLRFFEE